MSIKSNLSSCPGAAAARVCHLLSLAFFFVFIGLTSCKKESAPPSVSTATVSTADLASQSTGAKFGAMMGGDLTTPQRIKALQMLNVNYVRTAIILRQFNGKADQVDRYMNQGFKV